MKKRFRIKNIRSNGSSFSNYSQYGVLSIKSRNYGIITANQLESIRRCILRKIKKKSIIWIRCQCKFPVTKKSAGSRMGKGVGSVYQHVAHIKQGMILIELQVNITKDLILFLNELTLRLPVKASILVKSYY